MADRLPTFPDSPTDHEDDGGHLAHYHLVWVADAAAAATLDAPAAYRPAAGYRNLHVYGQISITFAGAAVAALALGDAADPNRHGDAAALTIGTKVNQATAAEPVDKTSAYTPRITLDQAATTGQMVVHIEYDLPTYPKTFA